MLYISEVEFDSDSDLSESFACFSSVNFTIGTNSDLFVSFYLFALNKNKWIDKDISILGSSIAVANLLTWLLDLRA